ncbi:MAG: fumarylacetoacetate hydrolase family protein, partial [Rhodospirillaceae bacterium]
PLSKAKLAAPIAEPRKLVISGLNSYSHLKELEELTGEIEPPRYPMLIGKAASSVTGPFDNVVLPPETKKLDYECELAVVIGRRCRRVAPENIRGYLAGYMVMNDVSARDVQLADGQALFYRVHFPGKSFDTFCPTGPALVTIDEFPAKRVMKMR